MIRSGLNAVYSMFDQVELWLKNQQSELIALLESYEPSLRFNHDAWQYQGHGGGLTCLLEGGDLFDRAGVNFSSIKGARLPVSATEKRPELEGLPFQAMGISVVVHPKNPFVPTCHANFRLISVRQSEQTVWWFGGGFDLTPYYGFNEDCVLWHQAAKDACDYLGPSVYPQFKQQCDDYFYLPHRNEPRGIGGIFFDDLNEGGFDHCFAFMQQAAKQFTKAYHSIVEKRYNMPYQAHHTHFMHYRRGRYVEFNLLYDRGTLFGIQSKGRTESILMSMPSTVHWRYNWSPEPGSPESMLYKNFLVAKNWLGETSSSCP